ncbi:MAG: twin-arginine translocation signal domain-containing protein [Candidatus Sumerlaeota bacterium]|nr:twin-arginine translocation signal domain-containing protein [Candidatus Sumerlaeota bacterium]
MMNQQLNRRTFLGTTALAGGALLTGCGTLQASKNIQSAASAEAASAEAAWPRLAPARIYMVFAGRTGGAYLSRPTDELSKFDKRFADLEKKLGDVKFIGGEMIPPAKVEEIIPKLAEADALLIIHLSGHGGDAPVLSKLVDVGLPTALFSQPFSGHGWMYFPQWNKQGKKVMLMPTSNWDELDQTISLMRVPAMMKQSRVLSIGAPHGTDAACSAAEVKKRLGADLITIPNDRVMQEFKAIDDKAATAEADSYWISQAREIVEPKRPEIIDSARLFLAIKKIMIEEKAQAICSRHCMGNPRGCLTFSKLNDMGLVGACEGDIDSTLTMLLFAYAFRVPGFITDPVIDTAKNAMIHFHCTSATKMDGPNGKRLPFRIRNQTDSQGGVAVEVQNRVGQPVTCAKLVNLDTMLVCPGKIIETGRSPLACRTQLTQSVRDARRLFLKNANGSCRPR